MFSCRENILENFALSLKNGGSLDLIKLSENTFRADVYDKQGNKTDSIEIDVDLFTEWAITGCQIFYN